MTDRTGQSEFIDWLDLCSIQGKVDWKKVKDHGFRGAVAKASQYSSTRDFSFQSYVAGARAVGMAAGGYHFAYCGSDPIKQAQFFVRCLTDDEGKIVGGSSGDMPPMLDLEFARNGDDGKPITNARIVEWGGAFMDEVKSLLYPHSSRVPVWYTYPNFAATQLAPYLEGSKLASYPLILARYKPGQWYPDDGWRPDLQPKGTKVIGCQYSGNGGYKVPGITPDCDRDIMFMSQGEWAEYLDLGRPVGENIHNVLEDSIVKDSYCDMRNCDVRGGR